MYRVLKDQGNNANITLENVDTKASVIIGKLTMDILELLEADGYTFNREEVSDSISLKDKWELDVSEETGKTLASKALKMTKPVRDQSKKAKDLFKKDNKKIDAMDVLLGLANYN